MKIATFVCLLQISLCSLEVVQVRKIIQQADLGEKQSSFVKQLGVEMPLGSETRLRSGTVDQEPQSLLKPKSSKLDVVKVTLEPLITESEVKIHFIDETVEVKTAESTGVVVESTAMVPLLNKSLPSEKIVSERSRALKLITSQIKDAASTAVVVDQLNIGEKLMKFLESATKQVGKFFMKSKLFPQTAIIGLISIVEIWSNLRSFGNDTVTRIPIIDLFITAMLDSALTILSKTNVLNIFDPLVDFKNAIKSSSRVKNFLSTSKNKALHFVYLVLYLEENSTILNGYLEQQKNNGKLSKWYASYMEYKNNPDNDTFSQYQTAQILLAIESKCSGCIGK